MVGYQEIKLKYGEKVLVMTVNEIIIQGIKAMEDLEEKSSFAMAVKRCFEDIRSCEWQDIRAIIKRNL